MTQPVQQSPYTLADWALCLIKAALANCGRPELSRAYVGAGQIAWDDCCGMLVVAPERVYRSRSFPAETGEEELCYGGDVVVDLVAVLVRCVPTVDDRGRAPSAAAIDAAYQTLLEDAAVVWGAIIGAVLPEEWLRANVSQTFVGAEGGCIAAETRFTIGLPQRAWSMR